MNDIMHVLKDMGHGKNDRTILILHGNTKREVDMYNKFGYSYLSYDMVKRI